MSLLELPSELLAHIVECLDDIDVFSARLSHRTIERACFSHFGQRYFRKRGFLVIGSSLHVLQSIAAHADLRKYAQHVWLNPDCYTFITPDCYPKPDDCTREGEHDAGPPDLWTPNAARIELPVQNPGCLTQFRSYILHKRDHERLMNTRELELRLVDAFKDLPNLMTVGMRRSEDYAPYGWRLLRDAIGQDPRVIGPIEYRPGIVMSGPTRLFIAIVKALAGIDRKLERLYTDAIELENIPAKVLSQRTMTNALSSIRYVELNIVKGWLTRVSDDSDESDADDSEASDFDRLHDSDHYGHGLVRFFKATPELLELGLQIFPDQRQSHLVPPTARDPSSWRRSYPFMAFKRLAAEVTLPHLTRIKLEKLTTTSKILSAFLRPCSERMTSLKLRDVRLLPTKEVARPWDATFTFLATQCPQLDYILFYHLMHDQGGVSFTEEPPEAPPAETDADDYIDDPIWPAHAGQIMFAKYDHITMQVSGRDEVKAKLEEIAEKHWHHRPLFSYAMDESMWHTDTSDEEW